MANLIEYYLRKFSPLAKLLTNAASLSMIRAQSDKNLSNSCPAMSNASQLSQKEITGLLRAWGTGEEEASEELIRAVYQELRRQARYQLRRERANHTLHTTALINEAYIKL